MSRRDRDLETSTSKREEGWISKTLRISEADILTQCGLDAYSFVRFLRLILVMIDTDGPIIPLRQKSTNLISKDRSLIGYI